VQLLDRGNFYRAQLASGDGQKVHVAVRVEIAAGKRALQVDAGQAIAECIPQAMDQLGQYKIELRNRCWCHWCHCFSIVVRIILKNKVWNRGRVRKIP
jgi:hypothetical protein